MPTTARLSATLLLTLLALAFAFLRLVPCWSDLWLDEIISLRLAAAGNLFAPVDNNHPFNTFLLSLLGQRSEYFFYRLPSLAFGLATLALPFIFWRRRRTAWLLFLALGFSFYLVTFASEARGYAPLVFFGLLAYFLHQELLTAFRWPKAISFFLACFAAAVSHPTFYFGYAGLFVAAALALRNKKKLLRLHLLPTALLGLLFALFYRQLTVLGSTFQPPLDLFIRALALTFGFSGKLLWPLALLAGVMLLTLGWALVRRAREPEAVAAGVALMANFAAIFASHDPSLGSERYYLFSLVLWLVWAAKALGEVNFGFVKAPKKIFLAAVCALYVAGNAWPISQFFLDGRGEYAEGVAFLAKHTPGPEITITSFQDFRVATVLGFYAPFAAFEKKQLHYLPGGSSEAEWLITERDWITRAWPLPVAAMGNVAIDPPAQQVNLGDTRYELVKTYPQFGLSGSGWSIYRKR